MSIRAIADRKILLNITNMDDRGGDKTDEIKPSGDNEIREVKGVQADPTPPAASPMVLNSTIGAQPVGDGTHSSRKPTNAATRKDCSRSTHGCSGKFLRSGGSGIQRTKDRTEECSDRAAKKRKTRRGKPKHRKLKPFTKQSMTYEQRLRCRAIGRLTKTGGQPPAPYNTTQFLMDDHSDLPDLDQKLADALTSEVPPSFQKPFAAPPRTRDSSFSIDSDEDYFYSSPENEEEFLTKEFSSAYEDLHAERLNTLTKSELLEEYVQLEAKFDLLTKRMKSKSVQQMDDKDNESKNNGTTSSCDSDIGKKLKTCQQRLDDLIQQNEQLRRENEALRAKYCSSPVSSVDSESDSDSSSNRSSCSSSSDGGDSPKTGKSYQTRREKDHRRNKRRCSVDSVSDSAASTTSSKDDSCARTHDLAPNPPANDLVNGNSTNHEIGGLPT